MENKINANGLAILNTLKANKGVALSFAEIANLAGIEAKTGFLTSAKKLAQAEQLTIVKVEGAVKVSVKTVSTYPTGLVVEKEKEVAMDGYILQNAEWLKTPKGVFFYGRIWRPISGVGQLYAARS